MSRWLRELFSEKGTVSSMRVMSFIALFVASYLAIDGKDTSVIIFLSAAFGGKCVQKKFELDGSQKETSNETVKEN